MGAQQSKTHDGLPQRVPDQDFVTNCTTSASSSRSNDGLMTLLQATEGSSGEEPSGEQASGTLQVDVKVSVPFSLRSTAHRTTIWCLGAPCTEGPKKLTIWQDGQRFCLPYPVGFRASIEVLAGTWEVSVLSDATTGLPKFQLAGPGGQLYTGSTPSAPWALACLQHRLGSSKLRGPELCGLTHPLVGRLLLASARVRPELSPPSPSRIPSEQPRTPVLPPTSQLTARPTAVRTSEVQRPRRKRQMTTISPWGDHPGADLFQRPSKKAASGAENSDSQSGLQPSSGTPVLASAMERSAPPRQPSPSSSPLKHSSGSPAIGPLSPPTPLSVRSVLPTSRSKLKPLAKAPRVLDVAPEVDRNGTPDGEGDDEEEEEAGGQQEDVASVLLGMARTLASPGKGLRGRAWGRNGGRSGGRGVSGSDGGEGGGGGGGASASGGGVATTGNGGSSITGLDVYSGHGENGLLGSHRGGTGAWKALVGQEDKREGRTAPKQKPMARSGGQCAIGGGLGVGATKERLGVRVRAINKPRARRPNQRYLGNDYLVEGINNVEEANHHHFPRKETGTLGRNELLTEMPLGERRGEAPLHNRARHSMSPSLEDDTHSIDAPHRKLTPHNSPRARSSTPNGVHVDLANGLELNGGIMWLPPPTMDPEEVHSM